MVIYLDSSALIKRYVDESGSNELDSFMEQASEILISRITVFEIYAILSRLLHTRQITHKEYQESKRDFQMTLKDYQISEFQSTTSKTASELFDDTYLKTLDILQLTFGILNREAIDYVVCSDTKLKAAFKEYGLEVFDPNDISQ